MIKKTFVRVTKEKYDVYTNVKGSNGVVVCTLRCYCNYITNQINHNPKNKSIIVDSKLYDIFEVKGVAVCNPKDIFNESLGRKIALSKAKKEMFRKASKYYEIYKDSFTTFSNELEQIIYNLNRAESTEYTHLQNLKENND